jgi:hypothetical protein
MSHPKHTVFSPARILAISSNTFLELVRLKVFYLLMIFGLVVMGIAAFMSQFSPQEQVQVIKDTSLGAMSIFSWLLSVLATAMLLPKDIEERTLYTILAKPVPRLEYLIGKLLGVFLLLLVSVLVMGTLFVGMLYFWEQSAIASAMSAGPTPDALSQVAGIRANCFTPSLSVAVSLIYLKAVLFATLTLFISTFATSSIFTIMVSVVVYFIGVVQSVAREYWLAAGNTSVLARIFLGFVAFFFPDLQLFDLVDDIAAGNALHASMLYQTIGLGFTYIGIYFLLAFFVFAKKEL